MVVLIKKYYRILSSFANTQQRESFDMSSKNDREWSGFSIYLALPLEHCLSAVGASLREAAKIGVCRKTAGTNVFLEDISKDSLCVCFLPSLRPSPTPSRLFLPCICPLHYSNYLINKNFTQPKFLVFIDFLYLIDYNYKQI